MTLNPLPPVALPSITIAIRKHAPSKSSTKGAYKRFKACLRADFSFSCAFCLLHEAELSGGQGAARTGLMGIEHLELRSKTRVEVQNSYANCYLACRFCNEARNAKPLHDPARGSLLDPCATPWADHFAAQGDRLVFDPANRDATYTDDTYDLNDERKVSRRRMRRELLMDRLPLAIELPLILQRLVSLAQGDAEKLAKAAEEAEKLTRLAADILLDVEGYAAVPKDADKRCLCGVT